VTGVRKHPSVLSIWVALTSLPTFAVSRMSTASTSGWSR
jgi:hypothetical protein